MVDEDAARDPLDSDEGGGPPIALPWTLVVESENWSADLEHGAPLPRVGERIEFIGLDGDRRHYRVSDVVHTVQGSANQRPRVRDEHRGPNAIVNDEEPVAAPRLLRAGLPRVIAAPED